MIKRELKIETSELFITVKADEKMWAENQKIAFDELKANLIVKGYRKGKAPLQIAKQNIGQKEIWTKAINKSLDQMAKVAGESLTAEDKILDAPTYSINKITESELEVTFIYAIYPEIKLANYKNTDIKFKQEQIKTESIKHELENLREKHALLKPKTGKIVKGDVVTFDFEGFIDDKPFDGGKATDFILEIGSNKFIPGFEEQMIGLEKQQEKDITVDFPAEYHVENLKGKPAIFKIKIKEIKTKELPNLDDEFAKETGINNVNTLKDLEKHLSQVLKEKNLFQAKHDFAMKLFDKIKQETKIIVPEQLITREVQAIINHFENNLKQQNWTLKDYIKQMNLTQEKLLEEFKIQAKQRLTDSFIFAEIARLEDIKPTEEDFENQYEKLAKIYQKSLDEIKKLISKAQAQVPIINEKVIDKLIELNS